MVQILPTTPSFGQQLGTGLGKGLQTLADFKLKEMQRKQIRGEEFQQRRLYQEQTKEALRQANLPEEWAYLDPAALSQIIKQKLRGPSLGEALYSYVTGRPWGGGFLNEEGLLGGTQKAGKVAGSAKAGLSKETLPSAGKYKEGQVAKNPDTGQIEYIIKNGEWEEYRG